MEGMPTKIHHHFTRTKYQNNLSGQFIVFNSKTGMTIKSMSRLHDLFVCVGFVRVCLQRGRVTLSLGLPEQAG